MLSDVDLRVIDLYGVAKPERTGPRRSVFVLDRDGRLIHVNTAYQVSNPDHYEAILDALRDL